MVESWLVPKGTIVPLDNALAVHPRDMLIQKMGKNRLPFEARMTAGYKEMERDRRRRRRG